MYAALWRRLPGGRRAKSAQCLVLALLVVAVLFLWVFPALAPHLPGGQVTIDPPSSSTTTGTTTGTTSPGAP
ncbi:hypothetical protein [Lapillicoccus jejuensis]|uniref:Uncharacterized protein n=1 Tax=Lapillicoccus jejuensis TaxID=402171 RepID=A0A542DZ03_9MICO|nr:hypothetical protein [Lapillicoccus jejuensis]TQJ08318.1 hypothetical protein FB458_1404 [Lapillicoccus jejuensis]